jgi:hypothetical protein
MSKANPWWCGFCRIEIGGDEQAFAHYANWRHPMVRDEPRQPFQKPEASTRKANESNSK